MENFTTVSWIFLAIALSSQKSPVDIKRISQVADGINHAVPDRTELQNSISWLLKKNLIVKINNKYSLSELGNQLKIHSKTDPGTIMLVWKNIENELRKYAMV
jgi:predicted transcriptional regulator